MKRNSPIVNLLQHKYEAVTRTKEVFKSPKLKQVFEDAGQTNDGNIYFGKNILRLIIKCGDYNLLHAHYLRMDLKSTEVTIHARRRNIHCIYNRK